jgi:hypothetical protein
MQVRNAMDASQFFRLHHLLPATSTSFRNRYSQSFTSTPTRIKVLISRLKQYDTILVLLFGSSERPHRQEEPLRRPYPTRQIVSLMSEAPASFVLGRSLLHLHMGAVERQFQQTISNCEVFFGG